MNERRRAERVPCRWRVQWSRSSTGKRTDAQAADVSPYGIFVITSQAEGINVGDKIALWVSPPDASGPVAVSGRVRWKSDRLRVGFGVELDEFAATIADSLESRRALGGEGFGTDEVTREIATTERPAALAAREPHLIVLRGEGMGRSIPVRGEVIIGRGSDVQLYIEGDEEVSRRHARIVVDQGVCRLEDLGSRNGTHVNGIRVEETVLHNGDRIQIGVGTVLKFTEDDHWESLLRESQKMEAIGRLAGGIAHDFNNLLTIISGNAELLEHLLGASAAESVNKAVRQIVQATDRASELTRQLLGLARRGKVKEEVADLSDLAVSVAELCRRTFPRSIAVTTKVQPSLTSLVDSAQIEQVLLNLSLNSRDAMLNGGSLTIRADAVELKAGNPALDRTGLMPGPYVRLSVIDTGTGMSPEIAARVFEPYFTTKEPGKGTGLGLAMAYGIVRNHGGALTLDTRAGSGTRFDVYLPPAETRSQRATSSATTVSAANWQSCILVVDDDDDVRNVTSALLRSLGHEVVVAKDGREAITVYRNRAADISCVLLDLMMPGMSGEETLRELRRQNPHVRVVICSGYNGEQVIRESDIPVLHKPFRLRELASTLEAVMGAPAQPSDAIH